MHGVVTDPQSPQRGARVLDQSAVSGGNLVGIHLVVAGLDVDDEDLANVILGLYLVAYAPGVDFFGTSLGFFGVDAGMRHDNISWEA
jgi:hypothetical protein